jgi:TPP-dependent pyruvate/acetoin dehydrogenase alpha subunit
VADISVRAAAYGIPGETVDGMDLLAVREAAGAAIARARAGDGPTLLECKTYRFCGHSKSDTGGNYRPKEEIAAWQERDPLASWRTRLLAEGVAEADIRQVEAVVEVEIEEATRFALDGPYAEDEALTGAYADMSIGAVGAGAAAIGVSR